MNKIKHQIKLLSISPFIPYDNVTHAGGKIYNYYVKNINNSTDINFKLITVANVKEQKLHDLSKYKINYSIRTYDRLQRFIRNILSVIIYFNPFSKWGSYFKFPYYKNYFIQRIKYLKKSGYFPDIISLEWTQCGLLIEKIKKIFPNSFYVILEHDIAFQRYGRKIYYQSGIIRYINKLQLSALKRNEIKSLKYSNLVACLNEKDASLIEKEGIKRNKICIVCPYFQNYNKINPSFKEKTLIFYGYMKRKENHLSVIWFIENVFVNLIKSYSDIKLLIIGSEPNKKLYKYENKNVKVFGFVDDVGKYLNKAICMIVPLLMGGGIKIKVLEGMSAGLPIITNSIGIEGIPAINKKEYLHAEKPDDYIKAIEYLLGNKATAKKIGINAKKFIKDKFNYEKSFLEYKNRLLEEFYKVK